MDKELKIRYDKDTLIEVLRMLICEAKSTKCDYAQGKITGYTKAIDLIKQTDFERKN